MGKMNIAPTKSNLLAVKAQLAVSEDGYELLEQKREILEVVEGAVPNARVELVLLEEVAEGKMTRDLTSSTLRQMLEEILTKD